MIKVYGLDISKRKIGIAVAYLDLEKNYNYVILPLRVISPEKFIDNIEELKKDSFCFVIGLPSKKYENFIRVKHFTHKYRNLLTPFFFQNEDFSTMLVESQDKKPNDDLAASVILENFFKKKTTEDIQTILTKL